MLPVSNYSDTGVSVGATDAVYRGNHGTDAVQKNEHKAVNTDSSEGGNTC